MHYQYEKDKTFGTIYEVEEFAIICDIKIIYYIRKINYKNHKKTVKDEINGYVFNNNKNGNSAIMFDEYIVNDKNGKNINYYQSFIYKYGIRISDIELNNIKYKLCNIETEKLKDSEKKINEINVKKITSGKTGKIIGSGIGKNEFFYIVQSIEKMKKQKKIHGIIIK